MGRGEGDALARAAESETHSRSPSAEEELDPDTPQTGSPRPFIRYEGGRPVPGEKIPIPWSSWANVVTRGEFTQFDDTFSEAISDADYCLCQVCGESMGEEKVFISTREYEHTEYESAEEEARAAELEDERVFSPITNGPAMHPKCALLAYHYCPHFRGATPAFYLYRGEGHGIDPDSLKPLPGDEFTAEVNWLVDPEASEITLAELKQMPRG